MRRFILTIALLLLSCSGKEERRSGIFLDQLQPRDSVLIGDQLSYGFALNDIGADAELVLPSWEGELVPGVEIVKPWRVDTLGLRKGRKGKPARLDLEASVVLTSFEEGLYELPPVSARLRYPDGVVDSRDFESMFSMLMPASPHTCVNEPMVFGMFLCARQMRVSAPRAMEKTASNSSSSTATNTSSAITDTSCPMCIKRDATAEKMALSRSALLGEKRGERLIPNIFMLY